MAKKRKNKSIQINIAPDQDNMILQSAKSVTSLKNLLRSIKDGTAVFVGQYADSRKEEAIRYLERTIEEKSE